MYDNSIRNKNNSRQFSIVSELEVGPFYMKRHVRSGPVRSLHCVQEPCCTRGGTDLCLQRCAAQVRATCMVIRQPPPPITIMIGTTRIMHILFDILDCSMGGLYCSRWGGRCASRLAWHTLLYPFPQLNQLLTSRPHEALSNRQQLPNPKSKNPKPSWPKP